MGWIEQYRIFCQVVESGSFTRAAEALRLPRSSVSTAVATLERRVGARLLHRTTRKVRPTRDGETFHARCLALLVRQAEMEAMFRSSDGRVEGRVSVSVPSRIGRLVLVPALPVFLREWPGIRVEVGMSDRAVDLPAEQVNCALRVGAIPADGLPSRLIGRIEQINVASPEYIESFGTPSSPGDLPVHRQVGYASPVTGRVADPCALAGLGMIQIPAYDMADQIRAGDLVEVMPDFRPAPMPANLVFHSSQPIPRSLRIFADWLEALVRERIAG